MTPVFALCLQGKMLLHCYDKETRSGLENMHPALGHNDQRIHCYELLIVRYVLIWGILDL